MVSVDGTGCTRALVPTFVSRSPTRNARQQKTSCIVGAGAVFQVQVQMLAQGFRDGRNSAKLELEKER
jgi:hypothetical protein